MSFWVSKKGEKMIKTLYPEYQRWSAKGSVYIVSDTHLEDEDCLYMDKNWPEPEQYMRECFQKITKNDTLIHLGDVGNPEYFARLKCHKVLILGNHDESATRFQPYFDEIYTGPLMIAEKILLSHEPVEITWAFNIHGHDHDPEHKGDRYHFNCAANVVGYVLINLKDIINGGYLKKVTSLHRLTVDNATMKKQKKATKTIEKSEIRKTPLWKDTDGRFEKYIQSLPNETIIFPSECVKKFNMDMVDAYLLLSEYEKRKMVSSVLYYCCPNCGELFGIYNSLFEIPQTVTRCSHCQHNIVDIDIIDNATVVYKKHDVQPRQLTEQEIKDKIEELNEKYSSDEKDEKCIEFAEWLTETANISVFFGNSYDGYADGFPVYSDYICSACGNVIEGEEADINHTECPFCGKRNLISTYALLDLFKDRVSEKEINGFVTYFQLLTTPKDGHNNNMEVEEADDGFDGMELGNLLFGNSRGNFHIEREPAQDHFGRFFDVIGADYCGWADSNSPLRQYEIDYGYDTEIFTLRPYYWGEDDAIAVLPNFVYKPEAIEIKWYKYPLRDAYSNIPLDETKIKEMLQHCTEYIIQNEVTGGKKHD